MGDGTTKWEKAIEAVQKDLRCSKTAMINTYMGSFAEMPCKYRCVLDAGHDGLCAFEIGGERLRKEGR